MKTVHVILNAHIDPVWLWPWTAGVDEVLNTCYTMCNLLDRHPDVIFTKGEAWGYDQILRHDVALFKRIKQHVIAGRWSVVGGWWVQPDCNLPNIDNMNQQISIGSNWFKDNFGLQPTVAYNVDSFGHSATIPNIVRAHKQNSYVFLRPMPHEKVLPARLFRWRSYRNTKCITAFRIADTYASTIYQTHQERVENSLADLPNGINHTMCFIGVGYHGGGPNEPIIDWIRSNKTKFKNTKLIFSSPEIYFKSIQSQLSLLPVVTGELQMHAVGCYSVHRKVKLGVRRAEHSLAIATNAIGIHPALSNRTMHKSIEDLWKNVCFNSFHDTLGGTCTASAARFPDDQLAGVRSEAELIANQLFKSKAHSLPHDSYQRIVIGNYSGLKYTDYIEHEPWLEWMKWGPNWVLRNKNNKIIQHQILEPESLMPGIATRILFKTSVAKNKISILRLARKNKPLKVVNDYNDAQKYFRIKNNYFIIKNQIKILLPEVRLLTDYSDTWSHDIKAYPDADFSTIKLLDTQFVEQGPIRYTYRVNGEIGDSDICFDWRYYNNSNFIELLLKVNWHEKHKLLRLNWRPGNKINYRYDAIPGGFLRRESAGNEVPFFDSSLLELANKQKVGVVSPDIFSFSGDRDQVNFTLLRATPYAHHGPYKLPPNLAHKFYTDQGDHTFKLRFYFKSANRDLLDSQANSLHRPPLIADLTRGMSWRPQYSAGPHEPYLDQSDWPDLKLGK